MDWGDYYDNASPLSNPSEIDDESSDDDDNGEENEGSEEQLWIPYITPVGQDNFVSTWNLAQTLLLPAPDSIVCPDPEAFGLSYNASDYELYEELSASWRSWRNHVSHLGLMDIYTVRLSLFSTLIMERFKHSARSVSSKLLNQLFQNQIVTFLRFIYSIRISIMHLSR